MLGLRWFRDRVTPDALARDHGISRATACRYVEEVLAVLADQAPDLRDALERARDEGFPQVILDGTIISADRCRETTVSVRGELIDVWYSGKAYTHGGSIHAVIAPEWFPLWVSVSEPGSVHDITAARIHALPALYRAAGTLQHITGSPGKISASPAPRASSPISSTATSNEIAEIISLAQFSGPGCHDRRCNCPCVTER